MIRWHRIFGVSSDGVANPFAFDFDDADSDAVLPPLTPASLESRESQVGETTFRSRSIRDGSLALLQM